MAHENLKFRLKIDLKDTWQPIYGAEHHGTFYMIYVKINKYEVIKNEYGIEVHSHNWDFRLQNYRGNITMGLVDTPSLKFSKDEKETQFGEILNINLSVKPFIKNDIISNCNLNVEKVIPKNMIAVTNVMLLNPPIELYNPKDLDNSLYINPYSHFRDGDHFNEVSTRPVGSKDPFPTPEDMGFGKFGICMPDVCYID
ncbi:hypothetical protein [Urechidicola croceus]|uniref:Uncharacterized protein n=1 Tax=Urechidicola croceus TaxID=1850246 RepID=A0A1D8P4P7_9FLAO|nr:hypothetical protein [Urechidicola croceus]AOW19534.1 hypothetical protein LPB138_02055 [Urechidicola croceus]